MGCASSKELRVRKSSRRRWAKKTVRQGLEENDGFSAIASAADVSFHNVSAVASPTADNSIRNEACIQEKSSRTQRSNSIDGAFQMPSFNATSLGTRQCSSAQPSVAGSEQAVSEGNNEELLPGCSEPQAETWEDHQRVLMTAAASTDEDEFSSIRSDSGSEGENPLVALRVGEVNASTFAVSTKFLQQLGENIADDQHNATFSSLSHLAPQSSESFQVVAKHYAGGFNYTLCEMGATIRILSSEQRQQLQLKELAILRATLRDGVIHSSVTGDGALWCHPAIEDGLPLPMSAFLRHDAAVGQKKERRKPPIGVSMTSPPMSQKRIFCHHLLRRYSEFHRELELHATDSAPVRSILSDPQLWSDMASQAKELHFITSAAICLRIDTLLKDESMLAAQPALYLSHLSVQDPECLSQQFANKNPIAIRTSHWNTGEAFRGFLRTHHRVQLEHATLIGMEWTKRHIASLSLDACQ